MFLDQSVETRRCPSCVSKNPCLVEESPVYFMFSVDNFFCVSRLTHYNRHTAESLSSTTVNAMNNCPKHPLDESREASVFWLWANTLQKRGDFTTEIPIPAGQPSYLWKSSPLRNLSYTYWVYHQATAKRHKSMTCGSSISAYYIACLDQGPDILRLWNQFKD